jgi:hypothetical protein
MSTRKTVICHFYNEEFLLPWWLKHHNQVFDHGIMIDYHSTDRSIDLIKKYCPSWEIRTTKNEFFDSEPIDAEVMEIEKKLEGWRIALNVTEFLYGNTDHLISKDEMTQFLIGNYVFVDMEDPAKGPTYLLHDYPLHAQRHWGFDPATVGGGPMPGGAMRRMNRSIHNFPMQYKGGRHFDGTKRSFDDLMIFYYGWGYIKDQGIERKTQILLKIHEGNSPHHRTKDQFLSELREQKHLCSDLTESLRPILDHNLRLTGQEW